MRPVLFAALACIVAMLAVAGEPEQARVAPSLEWIRDCLIRRGVPPRYVRIEEPAADERLSSRSEPRRILFWTRTPGLSQTVLISIGEGRFVSIQSCGLAELPVGHPRIQEALLHMLDRNFAMAGARFARQSSDGQIVLRADSRFDGGLTETELMKAVEELLLLADRETPKLREILAGSAD